MDKKNIKKMLGIAAVSDTADKWPVIRACQKTVADALAACCCSMAG